LRQRVAAIIGVVLAFLHVVARSLSISQAHDSLTQEGAEMARIFQQDACVVWLVVCVVCVVCLA
jgi:acid phosphatase class B